MKDPESETGPADAELIEVRASHHGQDWSPGGTRYGKYSSSGVHLDPGRTLAEPVGIGEVVEVVARAMEVFGDRTKALRWLRTPIPSLGDETPQEMLEREGGIEQVEDVLGRIEHGVW